MAYNRNQPYNDLPDLPPQSLQQTPEIFKKLVLSSRHIAVVNALCSSIPEPQLLINTIILQESKHSSTTTNF